MSSRTPIRDLVEMMSVDQLQAYINGYEPCEILNHVQDDTKAVFNR